MALNPIRKVTQVSQRQHGPVIDWFTLTLECGHTEDISVNKGASYTAPKEIDCRECAEIR